MSYFRPMIVDLLKSTSYTIKRAQGWDDSKKYHTFTLPAEREPIGSTDDYMNIIQRYTPRYWTLRHTYPDWFRRYARLRNFLDSTKFMVLGSGVPGFLGATGIRWDNIEIPHVTPYTLLSMYRLKRQDKSLNLGPVADSSWFDRTISRVTGDPGFQSYKSFGEALKRQQQLFDNIIFGAPIKTETVPLRYFLEGKAEYREEQARKIHDDIINTVMRRKDWRNIIGDMNPDDAKHTLKMATDLMITPLPRLKNIAIERAKRVGLPEDIQTNMGKKFDRLQEEQNLLYTIFFDMLTGPNGPVPDLPVEVKKYIIAVKNSMAQGEFNLNKIDNNPEFSRMAADFKHNLKLVTMHPDLIFSPELAGALSESFKTHYGYNPFSNVVDVAAILKVEPTLTGLTFARALLNQYLSDTPHVKSFNERLVDHIQRATKTMVNDVFGTLSVLPDRVTPSRLAETAKHLWENIDRWATDSIYYYSTTYSTNDLHILRNSSNVVGKWRVYKPTTQEVTEW